MSVTCRFSPRTASTSQAYHQEGWQWLIAETLKEEDCINTAIARCQYRNGLFLTESILRSWCSMYLFILLALSLGAKLIRAGVFMSMLRACNILLYSPVKMSTFETAGIRFQEEPYIFPVILECPSFNNWSFIAGPEVSTIVFISFFIVGGR